MKSHRNHGERGVALLMALFAIMLLSAIAIGLMYMSDTETSINRNYRDQQRAGFAAQAGLAEERERLTTSNTGTHLIVGPAGMPALANSVMYVINPASGETVTPTVPGSRYFDTQLCHENLAGLGM